MTRKIEVKIGKTEISVGGFTFIYPPLYGDYSEVCEELKKDNLRIPTLKETFILVVSNSANLNLSSLNKKYGEFELEVLKKINEIARGSKNYPLLTSTAIFYYPKKGGYIVDNPEIDVDLSKLKDTNLSELEKKLEKNEKARFVKKELFSSLRFNNVLSGRSLKKDPLIKELFGEEVEEFSEINEITIYIPQNTEEKYAAFIAAYLGNGSFCIDSRDIYRQGYVFGIKK